MADQSAARSLKPPLGGRSGDWRRRLLRFHLPIALATALVLVVFMGLPTFTDSGSHADITSGSFPQSRDSGMGAVDMDHDGGEDSAGLTMRFSEPGSRAFMSQLTVATGYVATVLLVLTLLIGPVNLLLRRRTPISTYLARDVGIWAAIFSIVHVILGVEGEAGGSNPLSFLDLFVADGRPLTNSFGLGNWTGLAATVIVIVLLVTSTDHALRELKARPWKNLQRLNYTLFALVIAHAFFYGALVQLTSPFTLLLIITVLAVLVGQAIGIRLYRRRHAGTPDRQRERDPRRV